MRGPLTNYAIEDAWANPQADRQHVIQLSRVSRDVGAINYVRVMQGDYMLPTQGDYYHVFVIGQNHPWVWNFGNEYITPLPYESWIPASEMMERFLLVTNTYMDNGVQFPTTDVYIRKCYNHNIIVAIREFPNMVVPRLVPVYMRVYSNAHYDDFRPDTNKEAIKSFGGKMSKPNQVLGWQNQYHKLKELPGKVMAFINGYLVDDFPPGSYRNNDWLSVVYDESVFRTVEFPIKPMETFMSDMDKRRKYIVHPSKVTYPDFDFIYHDDVDFYLIGENGKGVYYNRNLAENVRQLTHHDYALVVGNIRNLCDMNPGFGDPNKCRILAVMRRGGRTNQLVFDDQRVFDLYKLNDKQIIDAMVNVNSLIPEWTAARLEDSKYMELQGCQFKDLTERLVYEALGYHASTRVSSMSPLRVVKTPHGNYVDLPHSLDNNSTVYEYDSEGLYLGNQYHLMGRRYSPMNPSCDMVEVLSGKATKDLNYKFGNDDVVLNPSYGYRCYRTTWIDGEPNHDNWIDCTADKDIVIFDNGVLKWKHNKVRYVGLVIINDAFLGYDFKLNPPDRSYTFATTYEWDKGGMMSKFPLGDLDIIMNKRSLVRGLDYHFKFPRAVICNKLYLNKGYEQDFVLKHYGFCTDKLELQPVNEFGWVSAGSLSDDDIHQLRKDRVTRCVVDGRIFDSNDLVWAEEIKNGKGKLFDKLNGKPYQISNVMTSVRDSIPYDTYYNRDKSLDMDKRAGAYLTDKLAQQELHDPSVAGDKYILYSPFLNKVIHDIKLKVFIVGNLPVSDDRLDKMLLAYKWWLDFDPCVQGVSFANIIIHPHASFETISVTANEYKTLNRIIELYLNNRVQLSGHVNITG